MARRCTTHHMCDCTAEQLRELEAKLDEIDKARSDDAKAFEKRLEDAYARNRAVTEERDALSSRLELRKAEYAVLKEQYVKVCALANQTIEERDALSSRLKECAALVPTNWLDPLLTGPKSVLPGSTRELTAQHIERLLRAIKSRIEEHCAEKSPHHPACVTEVTGGLEGPCDCAPVVERQSAVCGAPGYDGALRCQLPTGHAHDHVANGKSWP